MSDRGQEATIAALHHSIEQHLPVSLTAPDSRSFLALATSAADLRARLSNLHVANVTEVTELDGRIENTDLSGSAGTPVVLEQRYGGSTTHANLDLGGGSLGSNGHNCIYGGAQADATTMNYDLTAKYNWWGSPQGPAPGRTLAINGTITSSPALTAAPPPVC